MKVSKSWLRELVDLKISNEELEKLLPLKTIGTKEITPDFIELDMKGYNRPDLLSLRGIAYEVSAITNSPVNFTEEENFIWSDNLPEVKVDIQNKELCPFYCVAKIEDLKVAPSPDGWVKKLSDSGIREVNNVADITNLVMVEYGQPLHAFDADKVSDETLTVRLASQGETLQTLDGKSRALDKQDLLIADSEKPLGLAGVMGGKDSEVNSSTSTILLEAAIFEPKTLRQTATRLSLPSEAGKRFQHGLTKKRLLQALNAAIKMYLQLGGKLTAISIVGDYPPQTKQVNLSVQKTSGLIGIEIAADQIKDCLEKLRFKVEGGPEKFTVTPPYYRLDIEHPEDLIEEVARMYGYGKIPAKELSGEAPKQIDQSAFELISKTKKTLVKLGLTEVQTYSFYSTKVIEIGGENLIRVSNPISAETEFLRQAIWPNLVEVVAKNKKYGFADIAVFEVGKVYWPSEGKPKEQNQLALALMNGSDNPLQELRQIMEEFIKSIGLQLSMEENELSEPFTDLFHPTRHLEIKLNGQAVGKIAEVHPRILGKFNIEKRVAVAELNLLP